MNALVPKRKLGITVIAILALVQSVGGVLRAVQWFDFGSDLMGQGLLILPLVGVLAYTRGLLVVVIALLYVAFAFGAFTRRDWAWSLGLVVAVVSLLLVLSVLIQGEAIVSALFWVIVPVTMLWYLFSPTGREALRREG